MIEAKVISFYLRTRGETAVISVSEHYNLAQSVFFTCREGKVFAHANFSANDVLDAEMYALQYFWTYYLNGWERVFYKWGHYLKKIGINIL